MYSDYTDNHPELKEELFDKDEPRLIRVKFKPKKDFWQLSAEEIEAELKELSKNDMPASQALKDEYANKGKVWKEYES